MHVTGVQLSFDVDDIHAFAERLHASGLRCEQPLALVMPRVW